MFLTGPPEEFVPAASRATTVVAIAVLWAGDVDEGAEAVRPFRDLAPEVDLVGPMPYADFQCMIDDPPGLHNYWSADYHDDFPDERARRVRQVRASSGRRPSRSRSWCRGAARSPASPRTRRRWRTATCRGSPIRSRCGRTPADADANIEWARAFRRDIARYANGGVYLNFIGDEGEDRVRAAFGDEKYARLAAIKGEWDPSNVFRGQPEHQACVDVGHRDQGTVTRRAP